MLLGEVRKNNTMVVSVEKHPAEFLAITVYFPNLLTLMVEVVSPVDQRKELAEPGFSVTEVMVDLMVSGKFKEKVSLYVIVLLMDRVSLVLSISPENDENTKMSFLPETSFEDNG